MTTNEKGNVAFGKAISYFTEKCYIVSLPLNDSQWYDMIIEKDNIFQTVQVKYTSQLGSSGAYACSLKLTSGTSRKSVYSIKDTPVDLLFCYCANGDMYLIPTRDFHNKTAIYLTRHRSIFGNKNTLDTSQYVLN